jgi:hypothetical protein
MARDRHGRLLVALGAIPPFGGERHAKLVRFTRAGRRDRTFGKGGTATVRARRWVGLALSSFQFDRHDRILAAGTAYDARYGEHDHSNYGRSHPLLVRLQG